MTAFDDHGKDFTDFVFLMRLQVTQDVRVELKKQELMTTNHSTDKSHH